MVVSREVNEEQGVREAMLAAWPPGRRGLARGHYIQLLEPLSPDTPVGKFLARRGEGVHHVGYGVSDVVAALDTVAGRAYGCSTSGRATARWGRRSRFSTPRTSGGVLTELVQAARPG